MPLPPKLLEELKPTIIAAGTWALELACPLVPAFFWTALITAILSNKISVTDIEKFMTDHDIKILPKYPNDRKEPYANGPPNSNINQGNRDDEVGP